MSANNVRLKNEKNLEQSFMKKNFVVEITSNITRKKLLKKKSEVIQIQSTT